jgi:hypothetical protein
MLIDNGAVYQLISIGLAFYKAECMGSMLQAFNYLKKISILTKLISNVSTGKLMKTSTYKPTIPKVTHLITLITIYSSHTDLIMTM